MLHKGLHEKHKNAKLKGFTVYTYGGYQDNIKFRTPTKGIVVVVMVFKLAIQNCKFDHHSCYNVMIMHLQSQGSGSYPYCCKKPVYLYASLETRFHFNRLPYHN